VNLAWRVVILTGCLAPYVYFGLRDVWHHKEHRPLPFGERVLHLTLTVALTIIVPHAYLGHYDIAIAGLILFVTARAFDEFIFHRKLHPAEIDLHAKTHFSFLVFVVGLVGARWLGT
jgi:hypothetical protein